MNPSAARHSEAFGFYGSLHPWGLTPTQWAAWLQKLLDNGRRSLQTAVSSGSHGANSLIRVIASERQA